MTAAANTNALDAWLKSNETLPCPHCTHPTNVDNLCAHRWPCCHRCCWNEHHHRHEAAAA